MQVQPNRKNINLKFLTMNRLSTRLLLTSICIIVFANMASAQVKSTDFIVGDALPDAPTLAPRGSYAIGVQTIEIINKGQIDILKSKGGVDPLYDRKLQLEVWYPAIVKDGKNQLTTYNATLGIYKDTSRPLIPYSLPGRATRDAKPNLSEGKFPLIVVSHGYPGSRLLLTYLTENLASKGYVVVAIGHTESTYSDKDGFQSTLLNRAKDILFVINQVASWNTPDSKHVLKGMADADNTGIVGYSMGGYGVLNAAGAGYSKKLDTTFAQLSGGSHAIKSRMTNDPEFKASLDPRIKAVVAFAPWGMQRGVWDAEGLEGLRVPTFFVAGNLDDVSGYENGIKAIYKGATNANRYMLTYFNARHNVAPNAPPAETLMPGINPNEFGHYSESSWNENRINNINQHFVTAFLGIQLKKLDYDKYLNVQPDSNVKPWTGFKIRSSTGMELLHAQSK
jgi:predicted dienelactone hydrolase